MKWRTRDGEVMEIHDMTTEHLRNAIAYMERHAERIQSSYLLNMPIVNEFPEEILDDLFSESPETFLKSYPVYQRLQRALKIREGQQ
jgi:hypothetical protein